MDLYLYRNDQKKNQIIFIGDVVSSEETKYVLFLDNINSFVCPMAVNTVYSLINDARLNVLKNAIFEVHVWFPFSKIV